MAGFNGSGTFVRTYNWVTDKGNSVKVTASRMDGEDDGFATGLSNCITKDGQTTTTVVIPFAQGWRTSDGSVGTPPQSWTSDTDSGWYRIGANNVGLSLAGSKVWDFGTATASVAGSLVLGGTLAVTGAVDFTATASAAVISGGSHIGASANFTATCAAVTLVASGAVNGASANFTSTCSAASFHATGLVTGASANFTATCAAVTLAASGAVTGASANFSATCEAVTVKGTNLAISGGTVSLPSGSVANAALTTPPGRVKISTATANNSATTLAITTGIDSTYRAYEFELINILHATDNTTFLFQISADGVTFRTANYLFAGIQVTSLGGSGAFNSTGGIGLTTSAASNSATFGGLTGRVTLYDPSNTATMKVMTVQTTHPRQAGGIDSLSGAGFYTNDQAVVTAVRIISASGNIASGTMTMYGIT